MFSWFQRKRVTSTAADETVARRQRMVEEQLRRRGIRDPRVLDAMGEVPRERFLPAAQRHLAYDDSAVPLSAGQTISQPFMVAYMTAVLEPAANARVLEIGTGSGYQAAVLARLAQHVYTVERIASLQQAASRVLAEIGAKNIYFRVGDGTLGWPEEAPFDRIMITAAAPHFPPSLRKQLADGGVMIAPLGSEKEQRIVRLRRSGDRFSEEAMLNCRFVPLIGEEGWRD